MYDGDITIAPLSKKINGKPPLKLREDSSNQQ